MAIPTPVILYGPDGHALPVNGDGFLQVGFTGEIAVGDIEVDFGTPITGEALEGAGGEGNLGWLSQINKTLVENLGGSGLTDAELRATPVPISNDALTELAAAISTELQVDVVSSALPTGAATQTTLAAILTALTASGLGALSVEMVNQLSSTIDSVTAVGDVAHDAADGGNPLKIGGKAQLTTAPAAVSAANDRANIFTDGQGRLMTRGGHQQLVGDVWSVVHRPAANTQATITKATPGAGKRLVVTSITVVLAGGAAAPAAIQTAATLVTDVGGAATELWGAVVALSATAGAMSGITESNLWLVGASDKDMRLRFEAAGGANTIESVAMSGVIISE